MKNIKKFFSRYCKKRKKCPIVGMRNIKTTLAVFICLIFYHLIGRESYMLAVIATVICMQGTIEKSFESGLSRFLGTLIGFVLGTILLILRNYMPFVFAGVLLAALGTMLLITLCSTINMPDSIVIGCLVLITIVMGQSTGEPIMYGINRLLDTFMGITIALVINLFGLRRNTSAKAS